jgi:hypothetical protein
MSVSLLLGSSYLWRRSLRQSEGGEFLTKPNWAAQCSLTVWGEGHSLDFLWMWSG